MWCLPSSLFFWWHADLIGPLLKKMKLWRLPKTEGSILKYKVPPLWPTYISEGRTPFSKAYGIKVRWYGEHVGENIAKLGNILKTHWELEGNIVWTHWESGKYEKSFPPPHPQNIKGKKQGTLSACLGLPIGCMKFLFPKDLGHHFWPGPTPLAKNTLPIQCWGTFDWKNINCPIFQKHFRSRELPVLDISKP